MAAPNPNPERISGQLWTLWLGFDVLEPTALLGGIWARKPGYHGAPVDLAGDDYSLWLPADKAGPRYAASAFDLTMSAAAMIRYTTRLDVAARARDERLHIDGHPILREFIGTKDGRSVYCYVLVGGRALGVGADAGPDPGRDDTHLWHLHGSVIRKFVNHPQLAARLLSVLSGESLAAWRARTTKTTTNTPGGDMQQKDPLAYRTGYAQRTVGQAVADQSNLRDWWVTPVGRPGVVNPPAPGSPAAMLLGMATDWQAESNRQKLRDEAILAAVHGLEPGEILARVDLRASQQIEALALMRTQIAQELAPMLVAAVGQHLAGQVAPDLLADASEVALRRVLGGLDQVGS